MEPTAVTPATPAPAAAAPTTVPAVDAAVASGKTSDFRAARRAERAGKPLAAVPVDTPKKAAAAPAQPAADGVDTAAPAAPAQPDPTVSKRQQQINDYERRIAEQDQRIRALESGRRDAPREEPAAPAQPAKETPEWKRFTAMAEAPKLEDFDSVSDHTAAMSLFIAKTMRAEERAGEQRRTQDQKRSTFLTERSQKFGDALKKAVAADPDFATKIPAAVASAKPLSGCVFDQKTKQLIDPTSGQAVTFANVAAEAAFRSENPAALLQHLHAHSADVQKILALPQDEWLDALARLDGRLNAGTAPAAAADLEPEPNHISAAPEPGTTLGSRPVEPGDAMEKAIKRGDTRTFRELRRQQRAAGQR